MKNKHPEKYLPQELDLMPLPLVSEATNDEVENFLHTAREKIGYTIEDVDFDGMFESNREPIFDASFIDYTKISYAEYIASIYKFHRSRNHWREARYYYQEYQELLAHHLALVLLTLHVGGSLHILRCVANHWNDLTLKYSTVEITSKIKITKNLPKATAQYIPEPYLLLTQIIFSE